MSVPKIGQQSLQNQFNSKKQLSGPVSRNLVETLFHALCKFVAIPSVSSQLKHREDCRQAGVWLKKFLSQLGAQATLVSNFACV